MSRGVMVMVSFIFVAISVAIFVMFARLNDRVNDLEDQLKVESNTRNSSHDTLASKLAELVTSGQLLSAKVDKNAEDNEATDKAQSFRIQKTEASDDLINDRITTVGDALKEKLQEVLLEVGKNAADYVTDQQSINETLVEHTQYIANNAADTSTNADKIVNNTQGVSANAELIAENAEAIVNAVAPPQFESSSTANPLEGDYTQDPFHEGSFSDTDEVIGFKIDSTRSDITGVLADGILQLFASEPLLRDEIFSVTVRATDANGNLSDPFTVEFHVRTVPVFDPVAQSVSIPQNTEPGRALYFAQSNVARTDVTYSVYQHHGEHQGLFEVTQPDSDSASVIVTTQNTLSLATTDAYNFYLDATTEFGVVGQLSVTVDTLVPIFGPKDSVDVLETHDMSGKIYTATFTEDSVEVSEISIDSSTRNDIIATSVDGVFELYATNSFERGETFEVALIATGTNGNSSEPFTVEFTVITVPVFDPYSSITVLPQNTEPGAVIEFQQSNVNYSDVSYSMSMLEEGVDDHFLLTQPVDSSGPIKVKTLLALSELSTTKYSFRLIATADESGTQGVFDATIDTTAPVFSSDASVSISETHSINEAIYEATFSSLPDDVTDFAIYSTTHTSNIFTTSSTDGVFGLFATESLAGVETFEVTLTATGTSGNPSDPFTVEFTVRTSPAFDPVLTTLIFPDGLPVDYHINLAQSDAHFEAVTYSLQQSDGAVDPDQYYRLTQPDSDTAQVVVTTVKALDESSTDVYNFRLVATTDDDYGDQGMLDVYITYEHPSNL